MGTHHNSPPPLATSVPTLPGTPRETQSTHHACSQGRGSSSIPAGAHPPQRHRRHPGRTTPQHAGASGPSQLTVDPSQLSGENRPGRRMFSFPNSCTAVC